MVLATVPAAPPTAKNQRATSCPAPISASVPYQLVSRLSCKAFWPADSAASDTPQPPGVRSSTGTARGGWFTARLLLLEGEDDRPVTLHVCQRPAPRFRLVKPLVEAADAGLAIVGPFALGVGVVHVEAEARAGAAG